jgi:hypothetical protein
MASYTEVMRPQLIQTAALLFASIIVYGVYQIGFQSYQLHSAILKRKKPETLSEKDNTKEKQEIIQDNAIGKSPIDFFVKKRIEDKVRKVQAEIEWKLSELKIFLRIHLVDYMEKEEVERLASHIRHFALKNDQREIIPLKYKELAQNDLSNIGWLLSKLFNRKREFSAEFIQKNFNLDSDALKTLSVKLKNSDATRIKVSQIEKFLQELEEKKEK